VGCRSIVLKGQIRFRCSVPGRAHRQRSQMTEHRMGIVAQTSTQAMASVVSSQAFLEVGPIQCRVVKRLRTTAMDHTSAKQNRRHRQMITTQHGLLILDRTFQVTGLSRCIGARRLDYRFNHSSSRRFKHSFLSHDCQIFAPLDSARQNLGALVDCVADVLHAQRERACV